MSEEPDMSDDGSGGDMSSGGDAEWPVCVSGEKEEFGEVTGEEPDGITVYADGRCVVSEYAGGFDGFFSTKAGALPSCHVFLENRK